MAATATVNRPPPAHPGLNGGNLHSHPNSSLPNSGQQDPGLHGTSQDPGPSSHPQQHVSARPIFYVPAPPPPPFFQYQWPMPFSYNPFVGFPSMSYGMVMPPFPPPPYMEAPAYILPHPHIQPVDYRRLLHPHAPTAQYQNPNQTRRIRLPHTVPVRETVNSAVQTEPTQRGVGGYSVESPPVSSDSGHGTASNSPSSSSSSSQKLNSAEVENCTLPSSNVKDLQVNRTCANDTVKNGFDIPHPAGTKTVPSCITTIIETQKCCKDSFGQGHVIPYRNGPCNMWSVSSPDSMVPVFNSSQQKDEANKERRVSIPDILSWGGSSPQATMLKMTDEVLPQNAHQLPSYETEVEHEKYASPTETKSGPLMADIPDANEDAENIFTSKGSETLFKILKLPFAFHELLSESRGDNEPVALVGSVRQCLSYKDEPLLSLNKAHMLLDDEQENGNETNPHEDTMEIIPYQVNSCQMKRKMNESVWSVESLAPFIPNKELLLQKGMFEPQIIIETTEEAKNGRLSTQNNLIVKSHKERRHSRRFSFSDSGPMSDSWLSFSTPAEKLRPSKRPEIESEIDSSETKGPKPSQSTPPLEKDPLVSPARKIILSIPTEEDTDKSSFSEQETNQSPKEDSFNVNEQQEKSPCSPVQDDAHLLNSVSGEKTSPTGQLLNEMGMDVEDGACRNEEVGQLRNEQLCVPIVDQMMAEVSPSRRHLVDCGIQCTDLQELKCLCEERRSSMGPSRKPPYKYTDTKKANNGKAEGFCMNGQLQKNQKRHGQGRSRGQEKQSNQQETYNGYCGKPGKSKGGKEGRKEGRNPRY